MRNMLGAYGEWAASLVGEEPGRLSFRRPEFGGLDAWRRKARERYQDFLLAPGSEPPPRPAVQHRFEYDGLEIEDLRWQLPQQPVVEVRLSARQRICGRGLGERRTMMRDIIDNERQRPRSQGLAAQRVAAARRRQLRCDSVGRNHILALVTPHLQPRADRILGEVYAKAGAPDRYRATFYDGPHKFDLDMQRDAFAWFDRWLKG